MGFSLSQKSERTLDALLTILQGGKGVNYPTPDGSNAWRNGGAMYFYEVDRKDQPHGGVEGDVQGPRGSLGKFKIDGEGKIVKFPGATPAQQRQAEANASAPGYRETVIPRV